MSTDNETYFTLPSDQTFAILNCESAFNSLTAKEKYYAHYFSQASWNGGLIVFLQTSPESPLIFSVLHRIFLVESVTDLKYKSLAAGVTEEEFNAFLIYACGFFSNSGNYKSFGDSKIVPGCSKEKFEIIVKESKAYKEESFFSYLSNLNLTKNFSTKKDLDSLPELWEEIKDPLYSLEKNEINLGIENNGINTYFSSNCTEEDAQCVTEYMQSKGLELYNTRCFKTVNDKMDYKCTYEIRLASVEIHDDPDITLPEEIFQNALFKITRGDYNLLLPPVVEYLEIAKQYAANETEMNMITKYIEHFVTGSLEEHKNATRFWVKNQKPSVESYIGFTSTYRDPAGVRGEFKGYVALVNQEKSKKFLNLVNNAEKLLPKLPWGKDYEMDEFMSPDFTSLDVLMFASSGIPSGLSGPKYEDICESEGSKNFYLENGVIARMKDKFPNFLSEEDQALFSKYLVSSFEIQVGLHELLGHGSGKLFKQSANGSLNFDENKVKNPFTGGSVTKYYKPGETYESVFGSIGPSFDECRSEGVGLYLCLEEDVLKIFGCENSEADDIIYVNWLSLFWAGLRALESYQPTSKKWLQAHSQARYVILRVCLEAGDDFIQITENEPGKNLRLTMDRSKIHTVGKKAVGDLLKILQYYRSTADIEGAKEFYNKYSEVPETGAYPWTKWRSIVLGQTKPRKILVQSNTKINDSGDVELINYEATCEGYIQSWIDRFPDAIVSDNLIKLCHEDKKYFELNDSKS